MRFVFWGIFVNQEKVSEYLEFLIRTEKGIPQGTLKNKEYVLNRLGKFLDKQNTTFKKATPEQMQDYFKTIKAFSTYNMMGTTILRFLGWLFNLEKGIKPKNMKWFHFISKKRMRKEADPKALEKHIITPEEYNKILDASRDKFGEYEALWEVYYLSGGRLDEPISMLIEDVIINGKNVSVAFPRSKTIPRVVPLCEYPHRLIRWLGNHPQRENPKAPLWINVHNEENVPLSTHTIQNTFYNLKKKIGIKDTLCVKAFRITRATIMFSKRSPDGGLIFSDKQMADFFGWQVETVPQRRAQYDMTDKKVLSKIIFDGITTTPQNYDILKQEKEAMETEYKHKITNLEEAFAKLLFMSDIKINKFISQEIDKQEAYQKFRQQLFEEEQVILAENPPTPRTKK
jgi:site-specific recombinase XerD